MKKLILSLVVTSLFVCPGLVAQRVLDKAPSVDKFRPIGELRVWTFVAKDSAIGQLTSTVTDRKKVDGIEGVTLTEQLVLDYNHLGSPMAMEIKGEHFVSLDGYYLGDDRSITVNGQTERQEVERDGDRIEGYFTRAGEKNDQEIVCPEATFAIDNNFPDQYELFFAMHGLEVGQTIEGSVLEPQTMLMTHYKAVVEDFSYTKIHAQRSDSVFLVNVFEPQPMLLYITKDGSLLKMNITGMDMRVYLDAVRRPRASASQQPKFSWSKLIGLVPNYILFVVFGCISVLFYIGSGYRWRSSYLALIAGMVVLWLILLTQVPLQEYMVRRFLLPAIKSGGSLYAVGMLPGLAAGVIQEALKLFTILALVRLLKVRSHQLVAIGAMIGAGFGIMEGCYLESMVPTGGQFSWNLLERAFLILFHVTSGGLIGHFLSGRVWKLAGVVLGLVVCNAAFRYLPLFVQNQVVDVQLMYLIIAFVSVVLLLVAMVLTKRRKTAA